MRKLFLAAVVCATATVALAAPSASAQTLGGCELDGTASFTPGLNTEAKDFNYSFNGVLGSCQSSEAGAPTSGTVSAGEVVTIGGTQFQEPVPSGNGSCLSSTTAGTAIVTWADGTRTVVDYSTTGAAAAVQLEGSVADSVTLQSVDGSTSTTVTTTRYAGASALGLLEFSPPDPTACNTPEGVVSAGISGLVGLGG
ncbi:MAG: hypothetical protein ACRDL6_02185 [Solirubrobacterales bacterium]